MTRVPEVRDPTFWNLGQVLIWIGTHDEGAVRRAGDECQSVVSVIARELADHAPRGELVTLDPAEQKKHGVKALVSKTVTVNEFRNSAWDALAGGKLRAFGIPKDEHAPREIPAHEWPQLELTYSLTGLPGLSWQDRRGSLSPAYENVRVKREDVLCVFSESEKPPRPRSPATAQISEANARLAYREWRGRAENKGGTTREADAAHMRELGISRERTFEFRRLYKNKGPGRPITARNPDKMGTNK